MKNLPVKTLSQKIYAVLFCVVIMTITAASDSLRGIFLPLFRSAFSLDETQTSLIIMISYAGNLLFLSIGGRLSDKIPIKRFTLCLILLWTTALTAYILTENYAVLLCFMIISMGGSTMISTAVNLMVPMLFAAPAMFVNLFNFCQGVGITLTQNIGGRFAGEFSAWHIINAILLGLAAISAVLLIPIKLPDRSEKKEKTGRPAVPVTKDPAFFILVLAFGSYFVAEHGMMNWMTSYAGEHLGLTVERSSMFLSLFFGGLTIGRLVFAPIVERLGAMRSLLIFSAAAAALYSAGIFTGTGGLYILAAAGIAFSIIYPTLVLLIGEFYDPSLVGTHTGLILGTATLFDIGFNAFFGSFVKSAGYGTAMTVLPAAMTVCAASLWVLRAVKRRRDSAQTSNL